MFILYSAYVTINQCLGDAVSWTAVSLKCYSVQLFVASSQASPTAVAARGLFQLCATLWLLRSCNKSQYRASRNAMISCHFFFFLPLFTAVEKVRYGCWDSSAIFKYSMYFLCTFYRNVFSLTVCTSRALVTSLALSDYERDRKKEKLQNACRKLVETSFNDREISDSSLSLPNDVSLVFLELINSKRSVN